MFGVTFENPWIEGALAARRRFPAFAVAIVAIVWVFAARALSRAARPALDAAVAHALDQRGDGAVAIGAYAAHVVLFFGLLILMALVGAISEGRSVWRAGWRPRSAMSWGFAVGLGGLLSSVAIAAIAGAVSAGPQPAQSGTLVGLAVGLAVFAFQTAAEEVYFRGWLQPILCARWGPWLGLTCASALFAGLHLLGGMRSATAVATLFLGGVMFGLLALRSGGLWAPWAAHFAWNWVESGGLGLEPQPDGPLTGAILHLRLGGAELWSGGTDNLNGSLATVIVLSVTVASLAAVRATAPRVSPNRSAPRAARRSGSVP